ncbi:MAG: hypothetical protein LBB68_06540 [Treponema sp.]|nr:hypothetical protein [Treponema sp.]
MKNNFSVFFSLSLIVFFVSCASIETVKYSPDLTEENAATMELNQWFEGYNFVWASLDIVKFDGTSVEWGGRDLIILLPEGKHNLDILMGWYAQNDYGRETWFDSDNISITVQKGEKYYIQCVPTVFKRTVEVQISNSENRIIFSNIFTLNHRI